MITNPIANLTKCLIVIASLCAAIQAQAQRTPTVNRGTGAAATGAGGRALGGGAAGTGTRGRVGKPKVGQLYPGNSILLSSSIVEPHDYGIHKGLIKLFGYQVGGSSSQKLPNWRWAEQDLISDIELQDRTFPGGRPTKSGKHHKWDQLFLRVKPPGK